MKRVTQADLQRIVDRINKMTNSPKASYIKTKDGKYVAQIGNGWALHRMHSLGGGVQDVLQVGHVSKPELHRLLFAFINGIETKETK